MASRPGERRFVVGPADAGKRLDRFLAGVVAEVSRSQLARQVAAGAVTVGGVRGVPSRKLRPGEAVLWTPPAVVETELAAEPIPLRVMHEDRWLIVVDKPPGLVVHPAAGHEGGTLVNALLAHCGDLRGIGGERRPGIVHRIDKDTSGLLVVAKDDQTMVALAEDFKAHRIGRVYEAIAVGAPATDGGRIDTLHGRDPRHRKRFSTRVKNGRRAVTEWRVVERLAGAVRIEARLETGRTHQVRLHLAALGCPLLGDPIYGRPARDAKIREIGRRLGRQALHARKLAFRHPATGAWLDLETPPPADFQEALESLRVLGSISADAAAVRARR